MREVLVFLGIILCAFLTLYGGNSQVAAVSSAWVKEPVQKEFEIERSVPHIFTTCSGVVRQIPVEGWSMLRDACVFGGADGTRVARYVGSTGSYLYAVSFPTDTKFTPIHGLCLGRGGCVYGQEADALIVQEQGSNGLLSVFVDDFSKRLTKHTNQTTYYEFTFPSPSRYLMRGQTNVRTNATAVSKSGRWALIELPTYGFVRVDLSTFEYKRVVAPGASYGYGNNPTYEMTISDDGTKIAIVGQNASISIYEIDDDCGESMSGTVSTNFSPYTYACLSANVDTYGQFPGFRFAHAPRFSTDMNRLSMYVVVGQTTKYVSLAPRSTAQAIAAPLYIAFGDSFSSGEGETDDAFYIPSTNTQDNRCHVSTRSYPYLVGVFWDVETHNFSCSGGRTTDVRAASIQYASQNLSTKPSHISVGVGGNDVDLVGKLKTCLGIGTCEWAHPSKRRAGYEEMKSLFPRLTDLIEELKYTYPTAAVAVVGYPSVVRVGAGSECGAVLSALLNNDEREYLDQSVHYVNKVLKAAAHYSRVPYIDIENAYTGERLCDTNEHAMNAIRFGGDIAPIPLLHTVKLVGAESFHPTPRGHLLAAQHIHAQYGQPWQASACVDCEYDESFLDPTQYWQVTPGEESVQSVRQRAAQLLSRNRFLPGHAMRVAVPKHTFAAGTLVRIELHSSPIQLGDEYRASEDGSLDVMVALPDSTDGVYHTIHALGESYGGGEIDLYQTVAIAPEAPDSVSNDNNEMVPPHDTASSVDTGSNATQGSSALRSVASRILSRTDPVNIEQPVGVIAEVAQNEVAGVSTERPADTLRGESDAAATDKNYWSIAGVVIVSILAAMLITYWITQRQV